jgi:glycosyltransferase involved in cell wall biosynthesis
VKQHRIGTLLALDLAPNARFLAAARSAGVNRIVSYWGAPMSGENRGVKLLMKRVEVSVLRRSKPDLFIFESEAMRKLAVRGRGIAARSTAVVHTGVDEQKFTPLPGVSTRAHERLGIPANRHIVVYMGHLSKRKGVHVLMQAMTHIVEVMGRNDVHCLFLGNRDGEQQSFAAHWQSVQDQVTFGGYQQDIPQLLAGCSVGCIPSTGWDSFPMSSLEMQSCGLPVVVSDWQGVPETVDAGTTGLVVPTGDVQALARAIVFLIDAPAERERMSIAARRRIEAEFTIEHQVGNLLSKLAPPKLSG